MASAGEHAMLPEQLLRNQSWMRALAHSLLADSASADDVFQEANLAAWRRPPREATAVRAWLGSVVRNLSQQSLRERYRRVAREERAARRERIASTPGELLERAEMQRNVAQAVLDLEEPYRSTVLFRFFDELSPAQIAARQKIPIATVRTRLDRALQKLRERLDGMHGGDRASWGAILLPFTVPPSGAPAASGAAAGAPSTALGNIASNISGSLTAAAPAAAALQIGGIIMSQKVIVAATIALVAAGVGFGIGRKSTTEKSQQGDAAMPVVARSDYEAVEALHSEAIAEVAKLKVEAENSTKREQDLEAKILALGSELEALRAATAPKSAPPSEADLLYVSFGKWGDMDEFRNADWDEMGQASAAMMKMLVDVVERQKRGEGLPEGFQSNVATENAKLVKYAMSIIGKVPTHANGNGEYCHPITFANIMASILENAGQPFSKEQFDAIIRYGEEYDEAYQKAQNGYSEETMYAEKILDELVLKRDTMRRIEELFTDEQRALLIHPELHNRAQIDVLSPALMLMMVVEPWSLPSAEKVRADVEQSYAARYGFDRETLLGTPGVFDEWFVEVQPLLTPVAADEVPFMLLDDAIAAGQAHVKVLKSLLAKLALTEDEQKKIREQRGWTLPQVLKAPAAAETPAQN